MKHLFNAAASCTQKTVATPFLYQSKNNATRILFSLVLSGTILFTSCKKQNVDAPVINDQSIAANADMESLATHSITAQELKLARQATEKYQNIDSAFADGYADIGVAMPNMGYHFQRLDIVDSVFDISHPELLVYNKDNTGAFKLVAVEYAIPLDKSVNAPKGFTGKQDVWDANADFGLWLLHAWVWKYNPDGVFNPTNPLVNVIIP
ncbi:hypothetical protein FRZ67_16115 [Panacibacter ginsenosidivorans]|uniref:Uncharacterized protein n=1 Tax=Panacibacter ginsenosidivorans TaxID=1813871 RepID=A0A5B8VBD5_9BACT|nr:hypothetical protein [Panacibacter ginsenosidivorans]QEC68754.1 hypothetical protein FRZ67_16115 [Panacibacter ginsenosidivorans]